MKTIKKKIPKFKTVDDEIEILYGKNKKPIAKIVPLLEQKK